MSNIKMNRRQALRIMGLGSCVAAFSSEALAGLGRSLLGSVNGVPGQPQGGAYKEKEVFRNEDVIIRQIDEHTWEGNGHLMSNETIYIIEGDEKAILLDMGTKIVDLDKIVAGITEKPIIPIATHVHPDHTGSAINYFPELWINAGDMVNVPSMMGDYKGKINYLSDGQVFDLGGRQIEVVFAPGHTPGSALFFDKDKRYGFSGDAFGSGNLLLFTNFSTLLATSTRTESYIARYGITKMYPGHYYGSNAETPERISNLRLISQEMLQGTRKGEVSDPPSMGLNAYVRDFGVTVRFSDPDAVK